ncbi:MAG: hypothetical protein Q8J64_02350 [Thermodesulfovibrionales bacterium]|nr:hypothetical protein [Thermodesulfovibrionales bacterium]
MQEKSPYKIYMPAVLSGALLAFAFPKFDLYPVAWFCLAPFIVSLYGMSPKQAFRAGMLMGIPYFYGTDYWIYYSVHHYGGVPFVPSLLIVLLLSLYLSLYTGKKLTNPATVTFLPKPWAFFI